jgi:hypothetical protein
VVVGVEFFYSEPVTDEVLKHISTLAEVLDGKTGRYFRDASNVQNVRSIAAGQRGAAEN